MRLKAADEVFERPEEAVRDADLTVFCVPILSTPELVKACRNAFAKRCLVTDVGSTKAELTREIEAALKDSDAVYVGSHPIAGSEQQGLDAARADLYERAVVVVTPGARETEWAKAQLTAFWESVGSVVQVMTPEEHDRVMARTSHLPHLIACLLAGTVGRGGDAGVIGRYCGPGFRDATRIADGSPEIWHDIIHSNRQSMAGELEVFKRELESLLRIIQDGDSSRLRVFLDEGRSRRRALLQGRLAFDQRGEQ